MLFGWLKTLFLIIRTYSFIPSFSKLFKYYSFFPLNAVTIFTLHIISLYKEYEDPGYKNMRKLQKPKRLIVLRKHCESINCLVEEEEELLKKTFVKLCVFLKK